MKLLAMAKKEKAEASAQAKRYAPHIVVASLLSAVLVVFAAYSIYYHERFLPQTFVNGVSLSGMTKDDALALLLEKEQAFLQSDITLVGKEKRFITKPSDLGASFSTSTTLDALWKSQHSGGFFHGVKEKALALVQSKRVSEVLTLFAGDTRAVFEENVLSQVEQPYREVGLAIAPGKVEIVPGEAGERVNLLALEESMQQLFLNGGREVVMVFEPFTPELTPENASKAKAVAEAMITSPWTVRLGSVSSATISPAEMASLIGVTVSKNSASPELLLTANVKKVEELVNAWAVATNREATNARLGMVGEVVSVVNEGQSGRSLNQELARKAVAAVIEKNLSPDEYTITLEVDEVAPPVGAATLAELGITERVATATTDFAGSPANRRGNIILGAKLLDRKLVRPGEVFSTIGNLGPITTEAGFLNELVIKGTRTIPEAGGGLCQVSTTLFRAVLNAGMPIVERQNHSYRVGYYEREVGPGLDATIYDPNPDFRWKNDFTTALFVQSQVVGNKVTFELYGKGDGRVAEIGKPVILEETPPGDTIYVNTDTLYVGEQKQIETAKSGATTTVSYSVKRDGKQIYATTFRSKYKNWPAQFLVGTKQRPEVAATSQPTTDPSITPAP